MLFAWIKKKEQRDIYWGPPRGKRDGVIQHILERENGNWMKIIASLRDKSIWYPAWLGKVGVNMNSRQFLGVLCAKNLRESRISTSRLGGPWEVLPKMWASRGYLFNRGKFLSSVKSFCFPSFNPDHPPLTLILLKNNIEILAYKNISNHIIFRL